MVRRDCPQSDSLCIVSNMVILYEKCMRASFFDFYIPFSCIVENLTVKACSQRTNAKVKKIKEQSDEIKNNGKHQRKFSLSRSLLLAVGRP